MSEKKLAQNGKRGSKPGKPKFTDSLGTPVQRPDGKLIDLLEKIFDDYHDAPQRALDPAAYEQRRHDFAFHMTDWISDLESLQKLYGDPKVVSKKVAGEFIAGFLIHVIPHLNAAGRLLLDDIRDPFASQVANGRAGIS